jgi:hypothetical protein
VFGRVMALQALKNAVRLGRRCSATIWLRGRGRGAAGAQERSKLAEFSLRRAARDSRLVRSREQEEVDVGRLHAAMLLKIKSAMDVYCRLSQRW